LTTEISRKIYSIMAREMGHLGKFIVEKQCKDLGINPEEIVENDVDKVADAIRNVMVSFSGEEKAKKIWMEIKRLKHNQNKI
jgi:hypothetical protein